MGDCPVYLRLLALVCLACLLLTLACGAQQRTPPPRSPLADTPAASTGPGGATPPPSTPPAGASAIPSSAAPAAGEREAAAGRATALLAEWLAIPERDLALLAVEAVAWPDACLGITQPGVVCASAVTPGFKVLLRDPTGGTHAVHSDATGSRARWAGEATVRGVVETIDQAARRLTVRVAGQPGAPLQLRLVPGSSVRGGTVDARVILAFDPASTSAGGPVLAWLIPDPN